MCTLDEIKCLIHSYYDMPNSDFFLIKDTVGSGNNYILKTHYDKYFVKLFNLQNPKYCIIDEIVACELINKSQGITSVFLPNRYGNKVTLLPCNLALHVQHWFEGKTWGFNSFSNHLLEDSICVLKTINLERSTTQKQQKLNLIIL